MKIRFWGVRGNVAMPGAYTIKYGGNTSCIEIRGNENELLIIDAGTGLREFGNYLMANDIKKGPLDAHILLTHTHWDHIQGFPFFIPAFVPTNNITFYGPVGGDETLEGVVAGQMNYSYFPIKLDELRAKIRFRDLSEGEFQIGNFNIKTKYLNHPVLVFGYRIEYKDRVIVTMFDNEPYNNIYDEDMQQKEPEKYKEAQEEAERLNNEMVEFAKDADLLIHDAQYTKDDYFNGKKGWGHSYFEFAIENGVKSNSKMLALTHHEYVDKKLDEYEKFSKQYAKDLNSDMFVFCARERLEIEL